MIKYCLGERLSETREGITLGENYIFMLRTVKRVHGTPAKSVLNCM